MRAYVQKNIMIEPELWQLAKIYADTTQDNISSVVRKALDEYIKAHSKNNLFYQMRTMTPILEDKEEEAEILAIVKEIQDRGIEIAEEVDIIEV